MYSSVFWFGSVLSKSVKVNLFFSFPFGAHGSPRGRETFSHLETTLPISFVVARPLCITFLVSSLPHFFRPPVLLFLLSFPLSLASSASLSAFASSLYFNMSNAVISVQPWLRFTATTVGRDKIYRGVQYFSRFLAWYLLRQGATKETVARFNNLKKTLALSRKRTVVLFSSLL